MRLNDKFLVTQSYGLAALRAASYILSSVTFILSSIIIPTYKYRGKRPLIPPVNRGEYGVVLILKGFPSF